MGVLTTTERVKAALRIPAGITYQDARIAQIVDEAEAELLQEVDLTAFAATTYAAFIDGSAIGGDRRVFVLPKFPVLSVVALTVNGSVLVYGTDYRWEASGRVRLVAPVEPTLDAIEATYTAGLVATAGTTDASLIRCATLMAARQYNMEGLAGLASLDVAPMKKSIARRGFGEDAADAELQRLLSRYRKPAG